jgi:hypothetical protein
MQLNEEGMQRFQQHLQNTLRNPCGICGSGNWQFDDTVFELRQFAGGGLATGGTIKPIVSITCNGCGNVVFMNALTTGIVRVAQQGSATTEQGSDQGDEDQPKQENISASETLEEAKG